MAPASKDQNGNGKFELPSGDLDKALYLVRAFGVPGLIMGALVWHGWEGAKVSREDRKEQESFIQETLSEISTESVAALSLTAEAVKSNQIQGQRVEAAIDAQIEVGEAVIEAVHSLNECVDELKDHNREVP